MELSYIVAGKKRKSEIFKDIRNPWDGQICSRVFLAKKEEIDEAVSLADRSFEKTRILPSYERASILEKISVGIDRRKEELVKWIVLQAGKPIRDSRAEVERAIFTFKVASEEAKRIGGEILDLDWRRGVDKRIGIIRRFPIGTILAITPFNFPLNLVAHKVAPAIAVGNPVILRPSTQTPSPSILLGEIIVESGYPEEAISVLPCSHDSIEHLFTDERIKKVTFTGSAEVGWGIKKKAWNKKVTLELGGNAGVIVEKDADLNFAVERVTIGAFSYAGQICISVQRVWIHEDVWEELIERFIERTKKLKVGNPLEEDTDIGPLIDDESAKRVKEWLEEAKSGGAIFLIGGEIKGRLMEPTIITNTKPNMKIFCGEAFAPLVIVEKYRELEEAINGVNNSIYGLQAGIFTNDIKKIYRAFETIDVGGVIVNDVPTFRIDHMPYGGVKESGFGREGIRWAMEEMTEVKLLALNFS
ncbi:MAG: aldehyde dehydrogenase family protein [Candidatus Aminicenantia bacterium]